MNFTKYKLVLMFHDLNNHPKSKFDVKWNEEKRNWFMLGEITDYTTGNTEDKGKYISYSEPISFYLKN